MRIMFCIPTLGYGGAERQLSYLAVDLVRMGHEIHVAFLRGGANEDRLREGGVVLHPLAAGGNHDPKIFIRLVGLIRKIRPDLIQTSLAQMDILGGGAALWTGMRWVLKESSTASGYSANWKNWLRGVMAKGANAIVSNSRQGEAYWRAKKIEAPLYVIPNGISLNEIAQAGPPGPADFSIDSAAKMLLFAGRMDRGKNLEDLVVALSLVAKETPFTAFFCGDGPIRPALERLATEMGIKRHVIFTGYVSNLWALMKRADAFVFLSRFEGCPNVVLEAMACGCPLIVSDIPAHREILDDQSACFVSIDDVTQIAAAVKRTLMFGCAARERANAAQERVAQWTIEVMSKRYEQLYLTVRSREETR